MTIFKSPLIAPRKQIEGHGHQAHIYECEVCTSKFCAMCYETCPECHKGTPVPGP